MRTFILIVLLGLVSSICKTQTNTEITAKRNVFNEKGDAYFERKEYKKAILYYNMAYSKDTSDYFSILKKADAFTKLNLHPQAEECYRFVFESNQKPNNLYRLKYALTLLSNNKQEECRKWIGLYSEVIDEEIGGENYLISSENRVKLYKDTAIVLISDSKQIDTLKFKIKYAGYKARRRPKPEDNNILLVVSNGEDHMISPSANNEFIFSFQPMEDYKLIIQREDILAEDIMKDKGLTAKQKTRKFLNPPPLQSSELKLEQGMKYEFSSGKSSISSQYLNALKATEGKYQNSDEDAIDLTALVKELQLMDGEVYTIRFARRDSYVNTSKKLEISTVTLNDQSINIYGQSFFIVLPDRAKENFAIQTDIETLEKEFKSSKYALHIDNAPVFVSNETDGPKWMVSLTVNTKNSVDVKPSNRLSGMEIGMVPGTEYMLSLSKPDPKTGEKIEVFVPLTRGVKYNFTSNQESGIQYKEELAEFMLGRKSVVLADEEVINISVLSKELEVQPGEDISFSLLPIKKFGNQQADSKPVISNLTVDEKVFEISSDEKFSINVPFDMKGRVCFQTDLAYVQENFNANSYTLQLDTISFDSEITVDTTGYGDLKSSGWLSVSVNAKTGEEVAKKDQFIAKDVSIIPGQEYILTVSKTDASTGKKEEIFVPLLRDVKYDFTSNPEAEEAYKESINDFLEGRENIEAADGTLIDITLLSKALQISEGDEISFSILPVRNLSKKPVTEAKEKSSLFLDNKVVEFTHIHKYTINMPLNDEGKVNMQTNIKHLQDNFDPGVLSVNLDTLSFFSEITIDTTGIGDRSISEEEITDPVFDVITVNFKVNEHILQPEAKEIILSSVIAELKSDNRLYVTIKGYTDALGDADYNLRLSRKRAESVKGYLTANGIGESRIRTFSFGEAQALEEGVNWEDLDEAELKKHRKVEIVIYLPE